MQVREGERPRPEEVHARSRARQADDRQVVHGVLLVAEVEGDGAADDGEAVNEAAAAVLAEEARLAARRHVDRHVADVRRLALRPVEARCGGVPRAHDNREVRDAPVELVVVLQVRSGGAAVGKVHHNTFRRLAKPTSPHCRGSKRRGSGGVFWSRGDWIRPG